MRGQRSSGEQIGVQVVAQIAQPLNLSCCRVFALCFRSARVEQFCNQFVMRSCLLALLLWPWFYRRVGFVLFFHRHLQKSALAIRHLTFHSTRTGRKAGQPVNSSVRLQWPQPQPVPNLAARQRADSVVSANIAKPRRFAAVRRALWIHARLSCAFVAAMNHNNISVLVLREINHCSLRLQPNPSVQRTRFAHR